MSRQTVDIYSRIRKLSPAVDSMAFALYDDENNSLDAFLCGPDVEDSVQPHRFQLDENAFLKSVTVSGIPRVLADVDQVMSENSSYAAWLLRQGARSSLAVPLAESAGGDFLGMVFFNSRIPHAFPEAVQAELAPFGGFINAWLLNKISITRALSASASIAQEFNNLRDFETGMHSERISQFSRIIAQELAPLHFKGADFVEAVASFAPLHDIGKIGIPDSILLKPGNLNAEERRIMEGHVEKGRQIVECILDGLQLRGQPAAEVMLNIVACHHEFLDGTGYPRGLKGEQVPLEARIVTVADIFDSLTSHRPYRTAWSVEDACHELRHMADAGRLDGECVSAIEHHGGQIARVLTAYRD